MAPFDGFSTNPARVDISVDNDDDIDVDFTETPAVRQGEIDMGKTRRDRYHHGEARAALVAAAKTLIAQSGVASFSLREAARVVGIDPAACYRHFRNRSDLLLALAQDGFTELAQAMQTEVRAPGGRAVLALGREYVTYAVNNPATFRLMFGESGVAAHDDRMRPRALERSPCELLEDALVAAAAAEGIELDAPGVAQMLWAAVHGVARLSVDGAQVWTPSQCVAWADRLATAVLRDAGLLPAT